MQIVFVSTIGYPTRIPEGGVPAYTREMAQALAAMGHEVAVISRAQRGYPDSEYDGKVKVYWLRLPDLHYYASKFLPKSTELVTPLKDLEWSRVIGRFVAQLYARQPFEVIEYPEVWAEGLFHPYHIAPLLSVVRLHTPMFIVRDIPDVKMNAGLRLHERLQTRAIRRAHLVTSPGTYLAAEFRARQLDRPVIPIGNPVDIQRFSPAHRTRPLADHADQPIRVFHPNPRLNDWQKGTKYLIEAIPAIIDAFPDVEFRFVGRGNVRGAFDVPERANIVELGWLSREDMANEYANADISVVPSLHWETGPITVLKSAASGVAICASAIGSIPEALDDGRAGLLVQPGDSAALAAAVLRLLRDPDLRRTHGQRARQHMETHYSAEVIAARLSQIYAAVQSSVNRPLAPA